MIGVLTIISILAAAAVPSLIARLRGDLQRSEEWRMQRIGEAFRTAVIATKSVPSTNLLDWTTLVSAQLADSDEHVSETRAGVPRILVYDPALDLGGVGPEGLPVHQGGAGVSTLTNARMVIVSVLDAGWPTVALDTEEGFSNLWNRADHALPGNWPEGWPEDPDDLFIERVDLSGVFHEVVLNNLDGYRAAPYAFLTNQLGGVGFTNSIAIDGQPVVTRLIHGTPLRLDFAGGQPQSIQLVSEDVSYSYENGRWHRHPLAGVNGPGTCGLLGQYVEQFMNHPDWAVTDIGTDPASAVLAMFDTLWGGTDWALADFENENGNSKWETPTARFLYDVAPQLMLTCEDLIDF
ncbi:MAG: hypothetical protein H7A47_06545 [Verrucomicrobiales bacterium]|nr:hypothetical protein [Verrucomicrobiales bacterium]